MRSARGPWILAGLVYVCAFLLFPLRSELLNACWGQPGDGSACDELVVTPDGQRGYDAGDVVRWLAPAGRDGRRVYAWSELSLDVAFPALYATLLAFVLFRARPTRWAAGSVAARLWRALALALPLSMASADLVENWNLFQAARHPAWSMLDHASAAPAGSPVVEETLQRALEAPTRAASAAGQVKWGALSGALAMALVGALASGSVGPALSLCWLARVPLAGLVALLALSTLGAGDQALPTVPNLLVLNHALDLGLVALVATYAAALAGFSLTLVWELGAQRADAELPPRPSWLARLPAGSARQGRVFMLAALPLIWRCCVRSVLERLSGGAGLSPLTAVLAALVGCGACWWLLEAVAWLRPRLSAGRGLPAHWSTWLHARLGPGYYAPGQSTLLPGHGLAAAGLALLLALYALGQHALAPDVAWPGSAALPGLAYLLGALTIVVSLFSGATFFFDRWRVPLLAVVVGFSTLLNQCGPVRHDFRAAWSSAALPTAGDALRARLQPDMPYVAVVTASGGGIQAAAWTARALTALARLDPEFPRRLGLISAVSGGSVGAYLFVSALDAEGRLTQDPARVVAAADASALEQVTWGLLYPDLQRGLWRRGNPYRDRGWALERAWQDHAAELGPTPDAKLSSWAARARAGSLPAIVFNAIRIDDGFPLHLATVSGPAGGGLDERFRYARGAGDVGFLDLQAATAARLSATFPYVSPLARPCEPLPDATRCADGLLPWRAADGGYLDNQGTLAALAWLDALDDLPGAPRVLWIHVDGFPEARADAGRLDVLPAWLTSLVGPPSGLVRVRTAGQALRHGIEQRLAMRAREVRAFTLRPPRERARQAPLSWGLGRIDRRRLDADWAEVEGSAQFARLREALRAPSRPPSP